MSFVFIPLPVRAPWDADVAVAKYLRENHGLAYTREEAIRFRLNDPKNWFKIALAQIYRESLA